MVSLSCNRTGWCMCNAAITPHSSIDAGNLFFPYYYHWHYQLLVDAFAVGSFCVCFFFSFSLFLFLLSLSLSLPPTGSFYCLSFCLVVRRLLTRSFASDVYACILWSSTLTQTDSLTAGVRSDCASLGRSSFLLWMSDTWEKNGFAVAADEVRILFFPHSFRQSIYWFFVALFSKTGACALFSQSFLSFLPLPLENRRMHCIPKKKERQTDARASAFLERRVRPGGESYILEKKEKETIRIPRWNEANKSQTHCKSFFIIK